MKEINFKMLKELGKIGNNIVAICRWHDNDEFKVQMLYRGNGQYGEYYKSVGGYNITQLNELFELTKGLKEKDFIEKVAPEKKEKVKKATKGKK